MLGVIVEFITFVPMIVLVVLFRKTNPYYKKTNRLENILRKIIGSNILETSQTTKSNEKQLRNKKFKFPWFFKIFLYLISFLTMGLSIAFVIIKGLNFLN